MEKTAKKVLKQQVPSFFENTKKIEKKPEIQKPEEQLRDLGKEYVKEHVCGRATKRLKAINKELHKIPPLGEKPWIYYCDKGPTLTVGRGLKRREEPKYYFQLAWEDDAFLNFHKEIACSYGEGLGEHYDGTDGWPFDSKEAARAFLDQIDEAMEYFINKLKKHLG